MPITQSQTEPTCAYPDCTQSVVPGTSFCGREDHTATNLLAGLQDGSASPAANSLLGYGDGTGRTARPVREARVDQTKSGLTQIQGVAVLYGVTTTIPDPFGFFRETIQAGALTQALRTSDCRLLFNHDGLSLARNTAGTLRLWEASDGVHFTADLDVKGSQLATDVVSSIRRGDMTQMSFGFIVGEDHWNEQMTDRVVTRVKDLLDVSPVTYPAYAGTSVSVVADDLRRAARQRALARRSQFQRQRQRLAQQGDSYAR